MKEAIERSECRVYAEIDLSAIRENYLKARTALNEKVNLLAVVKANAYGHGARRVAEMLSSLPESLRPAFFGVATADEALEIVPFAKGIPVLVLGHVLPSDFSRLIPLGVRIPVDSLEEAQAVSRAAKAAGTKAYVHAAVDTGMTRIGLEDTAESLEILERIARTEGLILEGVFSHLSCADLPDDGFSRKQEERFTAFVDAMKKRGIRPPVIHLANSAGASRGYEGWNMIRLGICLYGLKPSLDVPADTLSVSPAMSFRAHIVRIRKVPEGTSVSYGARFTTKRESVIATVSAGYSDGVLRSMKNGAVLIRGRRAPIVGTICMDQFMVDVTDLPEADLYDEVTLFGFDGGTLLDTDEIAEKAGTIGYELICSVSERVPRIFVDKGNRPE